MNIDSQIKQWAQLVRESMDDNFISESDGVPSDIDSNLKQLGQVSNTLKDKIQNVLSTQRDKIPEKKLKELIVKLIHIDPESVSDEDYKLVGIDKNEYMNLVKDITFESSTDTVLNEFEDWKPGDGSQDKQSDALLRQINDKLVKDNVDVTKFEKVDEVVNGFLQDLSTEQIYKLNNEWNRWAKKGGPKDEKYAKAFFAAGDSIKQTCINKSK